MVRPPCCDKLNVKRGVWTAEEDAKILAYVSKHGAGNWTSVPQKAGLRRCGKSCRLRWTNYLRPDLKHDNFTPEEEELIIRLHAAIGSRWAIIAQQLPGRTDNDVKNYWNTKLKKKLTEMGIDPVTHRPFSQILVDYGNIGGLCKPGNRIGSLNKDMKNAFISGKSEPFYQLSGFSNEMMIPSQTGSGSGDENNVNDSVDLLTQLQAIKLVTEASNHEITMSPQYCNEGSFSTSSSPSSSSSTCSTAGQEKSPLSFCWEDFLLDEDTILCTDPRNEYSSDDLTNKAQDVVPSDLNNNESSHIETNNTVGDTSSFVEALIDQENDMFLEFPHLLEDPCFYN